MKRRRNSQEIPAEIQALLNSRDIEYIAQGIFLADSIGIDGDTLISWMQRYAPVFINVFGYNLTGMDELAKETILLLLEYFSDSDFFQNVQVIDLYGMKLKQLPDEIGNLENLRELYLSSNNLTELPDSIGKLGALQRLIVPNNKLTKLPDSIGNIAFLEVLSLTQNNLTELPDSIGKIRWLADCLYPTTT